VTRDWPYSIGEDHNIVQFMPRCRVVESKCKTRGPTRVDEHDDPEFQDSVVPGLAKYERREDDDFRHRMTVNGIALAVNMLLIIIGVFLMNNVSN
jgi:hypothetical protein